MGGIIRVERIDDGAAVRVWLGEGEPVRFHAIWLRDNAFDPETRAAGNGQKLLTIADIPEETAIAEAAVDPAGDLEIVFHPDGKRCAFPAHWLAGHVYDRALPCEPGWIDPSRRLWTGDLGSNRPDILYSEAVANRRALGAWLADFRAHGFATMRDGPVEAGAIERVAALFGYIRETNYGRWFDVRTEVAPTNLAYTGLGLQAHTDNPYRDPVPTIQILYCLENSVAGGESAVVDGFMAARRLRDDHPDDFDLLSRHCARFEYSGASGVDLRARRPVIELAPDGELRAIRFNNRSSSALLDVPYDEVPGYYAAYRRFAAIIDDPAMAVTFRLEPGACFLVDNTRVLHARTAFSSTGARWLQGCYADMDGLLSTLSVLEAETREAAE